MNNSSTHLMFAMFFGIAAFILAILLFIMVGVDSKSIPWWMPFCELVLGFVTYSKWQEYVKATINEKELKKQTIRLEDTKDIETRPITQISTTNNTLFALCADGTVWYQEPSRNTSSTWIRISGIPAN